MEETLRCYSKEENPELNRQIEFIIKQLNSGKKIKAGHLKIVHQKNEKKKSVLT